MNLLRKLYWLKKKFRWNKEYKKGKWDFMQSDSEKNRYEKIVDWLKKEKANTILDLGCGDGILSKFIYLKTKPNYFLGVDFSENAIEKARNLGLNNTEFVVGDLHNFDTQLKFDAIVINEVLYYLDNWDLQLKRFSNFLEKDGCIILSLYKNKKEMIDKIENFYTVLEKEKVNGLDDKFWDMMLIKKSI